MQRLAETFLNCSIALGYAILITAVTNLTLNVEVELYQTAAFMALFMSVRHNRLPSALRD
jgi:hypothetical protein